MDSLVQFGKYDAMKTTPTSTMVYYVIKFVSEAYTLQDVTTRDGKIISDNQLVVKAHYLSYIQENINWYWEQKNQQQVIIVLTQTIVPPCRDVATVKYVHDITKSIFNRNNSKQALWKSPICLTDSDHDYILEEIEQRDKIDLERNLRDDDDEE